MRVKDLEKNREYQRNFYYRRRAVVDDLKLSRGCSECGFNTHVAALEFHHLVPGEKEGCVGKLLREASMERLLAEIAKCKVLCANCHRIVHATQ